MDQFEASRANFKCGTALRAVVEFYLSSIGNDRLMAAVFDG
jgi:hypothetical protein